MPRRAKRKSSPVVVSFAQKYAEKLTPQFIARLESGVGYVVDDPGKAFQVVSESIGRIYCDIAEEYMPSERFQAFQWQMSLLEKNVIHRISRDNARKKR